jgi:hypothetical protein
VKLNGGRQKAKGMGCKVRTVQKWAAYCAIPQADEGLDRTRQGRGEKKRIGSEKD